MVNFTVLGYGVLMSSKIICHFENSQLIFTWHKMVSMCAKFHCHIISSSTLDTPNKIGLNIIFYCYFFEIVVNLKTDSYQEFDFQKIGITRFQMSDHITQMIWQIQISWQRFSKIT